MTKTNRSVITVALVDDHPLMRKIVRQELSRSLTLQILWEAETISAILPQMAEATPNVLLLDLSFSGNPFDPTGFVRDLRARFPTTAILILTSFDDPVWVEELLSAGAGGYVVKSDDLSLRLIDAIQAMAAGRSFLSPTAVAALQQVNRRHTLTERERSVLRLASEGLSNPEIAVKIGVSDGTIRNHISNIYGKLNVTNREAAIKAAQGLRELPSPSASLKHELKTPLHTLIGVARLLERKLERDGSLTESDGELLRLIITEAERLERLL
jgi:DNA-binding NarL/FixJ family response regulator